MVMEDKATFRSFAFFAFADDIEKHNRDECNCDLREGGNGYCWIGEWVEGCADADMLLSWFDDKRIDELILNFMRTL